MTRIVLALTCFLWAAASGCAAHANSFIKFHVRNVDQIHVAHINNANVTTGFVYTSESNTELAFIRATDGNVTTFGIDGQHTGAIDVNNEGWITGFYGDGATVVHGFLRSPDGTIIPFDVPGPGLTSPSDINDQGAITGTYVTSQSKFHGFIRNPDGSIVTFDAGSHDGTIPRSIAADSSVAGEYYDGSTHHGFIRKADGSLAVFDPKGALDTTVAGMNDAGEIVGEFSDPQGQYHAYIREPNGNVTTFAVSRAGRTEPAAINNVGVVTGLFIDGRNVWHGFLRSPHGKAMVFDTGFDDVSSVVPYSINDQGSVAGDIGIFKHHTNRSRGFIGFFQ